MRIGLPLATLLMLTMLSACCTTPPAPARTYLVLPAVDDMEGVVRWFELQRTVAVKVDGLDPKSAEVRELDARLLAATEAWVAEEQQVLAAELRMLTHEQGLGSQHQRVIALKRAIEAASARLLQAQKRLQ